MLQPWDVQAEDFVPALDQYLASVTEVRGEEDDNSDLRELGWLEYDSSG